MKHPTRRERNRPLHRSQMLLGWIVSLAMVALLIYILFFVWLVPVRVTGDSMAPALMDGDVVLVDRAAKYWKSPARGDAVLFDDPNGGGALIKRIVGLPGETVSIDGGRVYIGGVPLTETAYASGECADLPALTVPAGSVFVLSDVRGDGYDSRMEGVGCIPLSEIGGVVRFRILPGTRLAYFY